MVWRAPVGGGRRPILGYDILKLGASPLFSELYSTFDLYNHLTFLPRNAPISQAIFHRTQEPLPGRLLTFLKGRIPRSSAVNYRSCTKTYRQHCWHPGTPIWHSLCPSRAEQRFIFPGIRCRTRLLSRKNSGRSEPKIGNRSLYCGHVSHLATCGTIWRQHLNH